MKNLAFLPILALLSALFFSSCGMNTMRYASVDAKSKMSSYKKIAVLPTHFVYTGKFPPHFSQADIDRAEENQSKMYQGSLYFSLQRKLAKKGVDIQSPEKTLGLLDDKGITIQESWTMDEEKLAEILGVDAVVRARVEEARLMPDGAAAAIAIGTTVAWNMVGPYRPGMYGPVNPPTVDVRNVCTFYDAKDGDPVYKIGFNRLASFNNPANQLNQHINRKISRRVKRMIKP